MTRFFLMSQCVGTLRAGPPRHTANTSLSLERQALAPCWQSDYEVWGSIACLFPALAPEPSHAGTGRRTEEEANIRFRGTIWIGLISWR